MLDSLRDIDIDKDEYRPLTNYNALDNGKILNIVTGYMITINGLTYKKFLPKGHLHWIEEGLLIPLAKYLCFSLSINKILFCGNKHSGKEIDLFIFLDRILRSEERRVGK